MERWGIRVQEHLRQTCLRAALLPLSNYLDMPHINTLQRASSESVVNFVSYKMCMSAAQLLEFPEIHTYPSIESRLHASVKSGLAHAQK